MKEKSPSQQSTNCFGKYRSNVLSDEFDVKTEDISFHKKGGIC